MATEVEAFVHAPSEELLDTMTKEQLLELSVHYEIEFSALQRRSKDGIKRVLKASLFDLNVLVEAPTPPLPALSALSFEEQKELLLIQHETEREKRCLEYEKVRLEQELEESRQQLE